ncbi:MAG: hypothetical protein EPO26_04975 [Chloroflexota bacterium]|nr:MAG: hypothetical protein EPO26_04975 [Chloroflexota bacterium]
MAIWLIAALVLFSIGLNVVGVRVRTRALGLGGLGLGLGLLAARYDGWGAAAAIAAATSALAIALVRSSDQEPAEAPMFDVPIRAIAAAIAGIGSLVVSAQLGALTGIPSDRWFSAVVPLGLAVTLLLARGVRTDLRLAMALIPLAIARAAAILGGEELFGEAAGLFVLGALAVSLPWLSALARRVAGGVGPIAATGACGVVAGGVALIAAAELILGASAATDLAIRVVVGSAVAIAALALSVVDTAPSTRTRVALATAILSVATIAEPTRLGLIATIGALALALMLADEGSDDKTRPRHGRLVDVASVLAGLGGSLVVAPVLVSALGATSPVVPVVLLGVGLCLSLGVLPIGVWSETVSRLHPIWSIVLVALPTVAIGGAVREMLDADATVLGLHGARAFLSTVAIGLALANAAFIVADGTPLALGQRVAGSRVAIAFALLGASAGVAAFEAILVERAIWWAALCVALMAQARVERRRSLLTRLATWPGFALVVASAGLGGLLPIGATGAIASAMATVPNSDPGLVVVVVTTTLSAAWALRRQAIVTAGLGDAPPRSTRLATIVAWMLIAIGLIASLVA